jgi:Lrp/AsnC family leucine-responsive transcriptional regulator
MELDIFDTRILNALQSNNQLTSKELAESVNLSAASCLRRAKRLRDEGVIVGDVSILAPEAVGKRLTMIVLVSLERETPHLLDEFKRSMTRTPEVMQCYYVTGEADFVLIVNAVDMAAYEEFTKRFFFENPNLKRFYTMAVMNRVKFTTRIEVEPNVEVSH